MKGIWPRGMALGISFLWVMQGCITKLDRKLWPAAPATFQQVKSEDRKYLKAHMRDGRVCIMEEWVFQESSRVLSGRGRCLDIHRDPLQRGFLQIPVDEIALLETNDVKFSLVNIPILVMDIAGGVMLGAAIVKALFGSCPTFYAPDGEGMRIQAEGFSASVAPSLEATDVDMLYWARPSDGHLTVQMTNEALETHVVRYVNVLAAPRPPGGRVFKTPTGTFWQVPELFAPTSCQAPEGDCLPWVRTLDGMERFSKADPEDLARRETVELEFPAPTGPIGLVLAFRQTLMTTYLFYQTLAYMGRSVGDWLTFLSRGGEHITRQVGGIAQELGGIEIFVQDSNGTWRREGFVQETGPIATDVHLVPLKRPPADRALRIRLRMTQGLWRLDYVALARLGGPVVPLRLSPQEGTWFRVADGTTTHLSTFPPSGWAYAVTVPGDVVTLIFSVPADGRDYELFLETRGYYLEWIRREWLREEDPAMFQKVMMRPREVLRTLAPAYKEIEDSMESVFWSSRYGRP